MSASPRTTAIALAPAEPRRTASHPSALATITAAYGARVRDVIKRGRSRSTWWASGGGSVREHELERGQADGRGDEVVAVPQRDVDGPVVPARFAELAGAVERVDDPDPVGVEPARVLESLLGQHGVVGAIAGAAGRRGSAGWRRRRRP